MQIPRSAHHDDKAKSKNIRVKNNADQDERKIEEAEPSEITQNPYFFSLLQYNSKMIK